MNPPNVKKTVRDEKHNVTIHILSYRELTREETAFQIGYWRANAMKRRKTEIRNKTITIETVIGSDGR
jgi:hypothetical protein